MAGRIRSDAARQPGAAGANPAVFFRRSRFSICAPGFCAGNCSEARFWVRFCVQKSRPLVRGLAGTPEWSLWDFSLQLWVGADRNESE